MISINFQWVPRATLRNLAVVGLMCINLWLIYIAASWGLADLFAKQAHHEMRQWKKPGITTETWKATYTTFTWAQIFEPSHPNLLESLGNIYYVLSSHYGLITVAEKRLARQQALDYYLKAAQQRPVSGYTWANIAVLKYQLKQYDAQFIAALEYASLLGPWEPFVQHTIADVGLAAWFKFPKEGRKKGRSVVFATLERGMYGQASQISKLIKKHRRGFVVCAYPEKTPKMAKFCP
ncbi:MAG: hypothetical protein DRR19_23940 [Candidatus Parabeggiatoa sp. nov. 1]|nr:MAG: hypothetical protein DRR19_23940 [Gammaproteobacteria bacterium]